MLLSSGLTRARLFQGALLAAFVLAASAAEAQNSGFQTYGFDQGLLNLGEGPIAEDGAGDLLIATENGAFAYDGRRFIALGLEHGLREGGRVIGLAVNESGRIAIEYPDEVYVSAEASDTSHPVTSLTFSPVSHPGISFYDDQGRHRLVAWHADFVVLSDDSAIRILASPGVPRVAAMPYDRGEWAELARPSRIFSVANHLWDAFDDGRVCRADPGAVTCYSASNGLPPGQTFDVVAGNHGQILARAAAAVSTLEPSSDRWTTASLPDQGGRYNAVPGFLGIYRAPDGSFVTQAVNGLDVLSKAGWSEQTIRDGAPGGTIVSAMTDRAGQLWFHVIGQGLVRWLGYGLWDSVERADGLSDGYPWQTARSASGALWVTTDDGLDKVVVRGATKRVTAILPGASYAIATLSDGKVIVGYKNKGFRLVENDRTWSAVVATPTITALLPTPDRALWIGTIKGIYRVMPPAVKPFRPSLVVTTGAAVLALTYDGDGGVYYLSGGRLHHCYADGRSVVIAGQEAIGGVQQVAMAVARDGSFWIGGSGGLYRLVVREDRIVSLRALPIEDTRSTVTYAIMVDHRGWLWFGTDLGITVFDGRRWASADADQGLLSNGVSEDGLREDPDGSVWIATNAGVSHLRDPGSLFVDRPLAVVVTQATLGSYAAGRGQLPYSRDPLLVELGTPNHGIERSVQFRYRLSGVDQGWVTSTSGVVRYPFVPPGRHTLTVVADDVLTHRQSAPTVLTIEIGFQWWRQWWALCAWAVLVLALGYAGVRVRYRAMYARQADLVRRVAEATAQIRHQAAHDEMTGLLVRREVERHLAERLKDRGGRDELVVALLDVDHFKTINDTCGHLGGDDVLRSLGRILRRHLHGAEVAGRYGGEEALLVLDDHDGNAADRILDLHLAVRHDLFNAGGRSIRVTCSIGVAWVSPGDTWETLIGRADAALYEAKHGGRDRVVESRHQPARV